MDEFKDIEYSKLIEMYLGLRRYKEDLKKRYEESLQPIADKMERLERFFNGEINRLGVKNISTASGTVVRTTWSKVNVNNWDDVIRFITENNRYDILEKRLAKNVVLDTLKQYKEDNLPPIPGISVETGLQVSIRKA